jgi:hypothetical protein
VIVGDQSSGKSSLLQSLTEIPFPVNSGLCTRFPTRIVSRRTLDEAEVTKISIERHDSSLEDPDDDPALKNRYQDFTRTLPGVITAEEFKDVIDKVRAKSMLFFKRLRVLMQNHRLQT